MSFSDNTLQDVVFTDYFVRIYTSWH